MKREHVCCSGRGHDGLPVLLGIVAAQSLDESDTQHDHIRLYTRQGAVGKSAAAVHKRCAMGMLDQDRVALARAVSPDGRRLFEWFVNRAVNGY